MIVILSHELEYLYNFRVISYHIIKAAPERAAKIHSLDYTKKLL